MSGIQEAPARGISSTLQYLGSWTQRRFKSLRLNSSWAVCTGSCTWAGGTQGWPVCLYRWLCFLTWGWTQDTWTSFSFRASARVSENKCITLSVMGTGVIQQLLTFFSRDTLALHPSSNARDLCLGWKSVKLTL